MKRTMNDFFGGASAQPQAAAAKRVAAERPVATSAAVAPKDDAVSPVAVAAVSKVGARSPAEMRSLSNLNAALARRALASQVPEGARLPRVALPEACYPCLL
jgi:hypothetical protein